MIYQQAPVCITNLVAAFGSDRYSIWAIQWAFVLLGLGVAVYALYLNERTTDSYVIQLDLAPGKVQAYTAQNEEEAAKIVHAINQAIAQME